MKGMDSKNVIYGLYCECLQCKDAHPGRIRYVGQTRVGIKERFRGHTRPYRLKNPYPVDRWKGEHGMENIRYRVLETLPDSEGLDQAEENWISKLRTFIGWGEGGLNANKGGQQWGQMSEESIEKIRIANSRDDVSWAKINREKAREIRELYSKGESTADLSDRFEISRGHVWSVLVNDVWPDPGYVYRKVPRAPRPKENRVSYLISRETAEDMRKWYQEDLDRTYDDVMKEFDVSRSVVLNVMNNHTYYDPEYKPGKPMGDEQRKKISESLKGVKKPAGHGEKVSAAIRGGRHGMSKLTEKDVIEIRKRFKRGEPQKEIGESFGIQQTQVSRIVRGVRWGHVREGLDQ